MLSRFLKVVFLTLVASHGTAQSREPGLDFIQVNEGVFDLRLDEVVDLTDRSVLLALVRDRRGKLAVRINGSIDPVTVGERYDLTQPFAPFFLESTFADKRRCHLDILAVSDPAGGVPSATFRLLCE